ncbi:hypothetical protein [Candidatus Magnetaquicoccus inordinatus]|uniref:hypothetical protein n=1 Tax=Candidatus Magnetaquicoccus inordinatus TaxID=2496818 RepID=UPI00102CAC64|nr:hypothetical protein [Candidatus Magnetaquicoccus inordinatus]
MSYTMHRSMAVLTVLILYLLGCIPVYGADYQEARWHPLHFPPAIDQASNADCLNCHQEIVQPSLRESSPSGVLPSQTLAWYQTIGGYEGEQKNFHQRHLTTALAKQVMNLQCNFCHRGSDPREKAPALSGENTAQEKRFTLRKTVNVEESCLRCHGRFPYESMELPGPWHEVGADMQNNCLLCHATIRTKRHQVSYLHGKAIEELAEKDSDLCYGCHGGRAWYRLSYPYPRHPWPDMPKTTPDWAKGRPSDSEQRFRLAGEKP